MSHPQQQFLDPFDDFPWFPPREIFARLGYSPAAADSDPYSLSGKLWELIYAMAARRFFLVHTNHLDDHALFAYLVDEWLDEETADIPPEAGWNCHVDLLDHGNDDVWLRFYADEGDRLALLATQPGATLPPREDPPSDRDRWLPVPPLPPAVWESPDGEDPAMGDNEDPESLQEEEEDDEDSEIPGDEEEDEDEEEEEDDLGPGRWARPIDLLPDFSVNLMPPAELTDETLTPRLWDLLHGLACLGFFLRHTDHLGDRELYESLWQGVLRADAFLPGQSIDAAWTHDFLGSGSDADEEIWLAYYASVADRSAHARASGAGLPVKLETPVQRDWRLPRSPSGL